MMVLMVTVMVTVMLTVMVVMAMVIIIITVTMEAVWTGWKRRHFCHLTLRSIHHMRISFYLSYFFIHFISLCFFICRLSLFSIHPRIFHPPHALFFISPKFANGPLLSISYVLSPHYEPVFVTPLSFFHYIRLFFIFPTDLKFLASGNSLPFSL